MLHGISQAVPRNAARVICGNCDTPFVFKEYESTAAARSVWEGEVASLDAAVEQAEESYNEAIVSRDKARLEVIKLVGVTVGRLEAGTCQHGVSSRVGVRCSYSSILQAFFPPVSVCCVCHPPTNDVHVQHELERCVARRERFEIRKLCSEY